MANKKGDKKGDKRNGSPTRCARKEDEKTLDTSEAQICTWPHAVSGVPRCLPAHPAIEDALVSKRPEAVLVRASLLLRKGKKWSWHAGHWRT